MLECCRKHWVGIKDESCHLLKEDLISHVGFTRKQTLRDYCAGMLCMRACSWDHSHRKRQEGSETGAEGKLDFDAVSMELLSQLHGELSTCKGPSYCTEVKKEWQAFIPGCCPNMTVGRSLGRSQLSCFRQGHSKLRSAFLQLSQQLGK